jgi:hypothetical protein
MLAWCEDKTDQMPLVRICNGLMGKPYLNGKKVVDEFEANKVLFDVPPCDNLSNSLLENISNVASIGDVGIFKA